MSPWLVLERIIIGAGLSLHLSSTEPFRVTSSSDTFSHHGTIILRVAWCTEWTPDRGGFDGAAQCWIFRLQS